MSDQQRNHQLAEFAIWVLTDQNHGVIRFARHEEMKSIIIHLAELHRRHLSESIDVSTDLQSAARSARDCFAKHYIEGDSLLDYYVFETAVRCARKDGNYAMSAKLAEWEYSKNTKGIAK